MKKNKSSNLVHVVINGTPMSCARKCGHAVMNRFGGSSGEGFWYIDVYELLLKKGITLGTDSAPVQDEVILVHTLKKYDEGISAGYNRFLFVGFGVTAAQIGRMIDIGIAQFDRCRLIMINEDLEHTIANHTPNMEDMIVSAYDRHNIDHHGVKSALGNAGLEFITLNGNQSVYNLTEQVVRQVGTLCPIPGGKLRCSKDSGNLPRRSFPNAALMGI